MIVYRRWQKVADVIRRDVPRPTTQPEVRWQKPGWFAPDGRRTCPMGLHPAAQSPTPCNVAQFPCAGIDEVDVVEFLSWWDTRDERSLPDAMAQIWGAP